MDFSFFFTVIKKSLSLFAEFEWWNLAEKQNFVERIKSGREIKNNQEKQKMVELYLKRPRHVTPMTIP